jgi:hypothetical protein
VRSSVQKIDEMKNRRELDQTRAKLNEAFTTAASRVESALHEEAPQIAQQIQNRQAERAAEAENAGVSVGDHVRIPKWKNTGEILELKGNKVKVAMGALQITLSTSDIEPLSASELKTVREMKSRNAGAAKPGKQRASWLDVPLVPASKVDILLVVDNSASMADKAEKLATSVGTLIRAVADLGDLHVGVVASSLGSFGGDVCPNEANYNPKGQPPPSLDGLQTERAIRAHAR